MKRTVTAAIAPLNKVFTNLRQVAEARRNAAEVKETEITRLIDEKADDVSEAERAEEILAKLSDLLEVE